MLGEVLQRKIESGNVQDRYAVSVQRRNTVVGHVPRKISAACLLFLQRARRICCTVIGVRSFSADLPQGGLTFCGFMASRSMLHLTLAFAFSRSLLVRAEDSPVIFLCRSVLRKIPVQSYCLYTFRLHFVQRLNDITTNFGRC